MAAAEAAEVSNHQWLTDVGVGDSRKLPHGSAKLNCSSIKIPQYVAGIEGRASSCRRSMEGI
jgi:hypothetical protein